MTDSKLKVDTTIKVEAAFPLTDGRWASFTASLTYVEGFLHKVSFPGFETRSTGEVGITVSIHVAQGVTGEGDHRSGAVERWTIENGLFVKKEMVASRVVLTRLG